MYSHGQTVLRVLLSDGTEVYIEPWCKGGSSAGDVLRRRIAAALQDSFDIDKVEEIPKA